MSATPSNLPRQKVPLAPAGPLASGRADRGKPVGSVGLLRPAPSYQPAPRSATLFNMPKEPEDAGLTGGTRSLERRLLALNLGRTPRVAKRSA